MFKLIMVCVLLVASSAHATDNFDYDFYSPKNSPFKSTASLNGATLCVPINWKKSSYFIENNFKFYISEYLNIEFGVESAVDGICDVIAIEKINKKDKTFISSQQNFQKIAEGQVSSTSPESSELSKSIETQCLQNKPQSTYFDCSCIANDYILRINNGTLSPRHNSVDSFINFHITGESKCVDKLGVKDDYNRFCAKFSGLMLKKYSKEQRKTICECSSEIFAEQFSQKPDLTGDSVSELRTKVMVQAPKVCL